jgi:hypothetical protein
VSCRNEADSKSNGLNRETSHDELNVRRGKWRKLDPTNPQRFVTRVSRASLASVRDLLSSDPAKVIQTESQTGMRQDVSPNPKARNVIVSLGRTEHIECVR